MSVADPNQLILTGENPFIRLSETDGAPFTTNASFWRIILCPAGPGHVLYLKSELTNDRWRIYSDNIAMARWLQSTVQGMLNPELADQAIPVTDAEFSTEGDPHNFWTERLVAHDEEIALTLVQYRRAAADPYPAECRARPAVRCMHCADPGTRRTPDAQRFPGARPSVAPRTRRPSLQHLRARLLRKLDRGTLTSNVIPRSIATRQSRSSARSGPSQQDQPHG